MEMRAVIFDLDNTIFDTENCKPYLRTAAGREIIAGLIAEGKLVVKEKFAGIVSYLNGLISSNVHIYIVSDSPKDYCIALLKKHAVLIKDEHVFGSQHKPCSERHDFYDFYDDILVVGDSPKDIYFAHLNLFPSVMLANLNEQQIESYQHWTKPGEICGNLVELSNVVNDFLRGNFLFSKNDFHSMYKTINPSTANILEIPEGNIGHAFEYWPNTQDWGGVETRKTVWFDVKRSIKVAKELSVNEIEKSSQVLFYNRNGVIGTGKAFKAIMWVYFQEFKSWLIENNIKGKVYLVPAPASVPMECNRSFPMLTLAEWWRKYAHHDKELDCELVDLYAVERFWPTTPAHMSDGKREIRPHFESLGVYTATPVVSDASALIIIDDIVTSGTQMNAVASLLLAVGIFPENVPLYGYALARTTRPGSSTSELLRLFSESEKAGA